MFQHVNWPVPKGDPYIDHILGMLHGQKKILPYYLSDLQITGEFKNRPDTGRCFTFLSLRDHKSYGGGPSSVYVNNDRCSTGTVQRTAGVFQRSVNYRTGPCNIRHHYFKKQVVKQGKFKPDSDSDWGANHSRTRLQQLQKHVFVACNSFSASQAK